MRHIPSLDGLRGIAILAVLGWHFLPSYFPGGFLGVDLFFVLSGFLITSLLMQKPRLRDFYIRRALRILPPLIAVILLARLFNQVTVKAMSASLFFYANLVDWPGMGSLSHLWSLAIEEHFYALWPLVFLRMERFRTAALLGTVIAAPILRSLLMFWGADDVAIYKCSLLRADALAVGCLVALHAFRLDLRKWTPWLVGAVLICFPFAIWLHPALLSVGHTAHAVLCGAALLSVLQSGPRILAHPVITYVGSRSYGLYLYHPVVIIAMHQTFGPTRELGLVSFVACFTLAELSFRSIEAGAKMIKRKHSEAGILPSGGAKAR